VRFSVTAMRPYLRPSTADENLMGIDQRVLDRDFVFRAGG
jgi:hypothetical protein